MPIRITYGKNCAEAYANSYAHAGPRSAQAAAAARRVYLATLAPRTYSLQLMQLFYTSYDLCLIFFHR